MNINIGEWPWIIMHRHGNKEHPAWYQRALVAGDYAPGRKPIPNYVLTLDGELPDPHEEPICGTCKKKVNVNNLTPVDRVTGARHFLDIFRSGRKDWKAGTNIDHCWNCNCASYKMESVKANIVANSIGKITLIPNKEIRVCSQCKKHFIKMADKMIKKAERI